jgi:site-specific DNA-methyltransferase (adenine-specific)
MIDLRQGDCLEIMKDIPDKSVDMILCDLPYGTTACKWDNVIPFEPLWEQYNRIIKDNGAIVLFGSEPFSSKLRLSNLKMYKYDWVWNKKKGGNPLLSKIHPIKITENISVFGKNKVNYYPIMTKRDKPKNRGKNTYKKVKQQTMFGLKTKHIHIYIQKTLLSFQMLHKKGSCTQHKNLLHCLNIL